MKVNVLYLLAFSLFAIDCQCQSEILYTNLSGNVEKTIVRDFNYPASISYVKTSTGGCFVYYDGVSYSPTKVEVIPLYEVNDFRIDDDTLYFCGSNTYGEGIVGHFNVYDFFFGSHDYIVLSSSFITELGMVGSFDKMGIYKYGSSRKIAAIGRTQSGTCFVSEMIYNPIAVTCSYRIGALDPLCQESFLDICVTSNYVVTAGFETSGATEKVSIRIYEKNSMFSPSGPQPYASEFTSVSSYVAGFDDGQILISHLYGDFFSVASYWRRPNSPVSNGTYLSIFNIASASDVSCSYSYYTTCNSVSQYGTLCEMTGFDIQTSWYLLQNVGLSNSQNIGSLIYKIDYLTTAGIFSANANIKTDAQFMSIDAPNGNAGFLLDGGWSSNPMSYVYCHSAKLFQNCMTDELIISLNDAMSIGVTYRPLMMSGADITSFHPNQGTVSQMGLLKDCWE